jgi:hypothetical protein
MKERASLLRPAPWSGRAHRHRAVKESRYWNLIAVIRGGRVRRRKTGSFRRTEPVYRSFIPTTGRGPCLTRVPTRSHQGQRVSAPIIPVLQASLPHEHLIEESPANSFRGSAPQSGQPGQLEDNADVATWPLENALFDNWRSEIAKADYRAFRQWRPPGTAPL